LPGAIQSPPGFLHPYHLLLPKSKICKVFPCLSSIVSCLSRPPFYLQLFPVSKNVFGYSSKVLSSCDCDPEFILMNERFGRARSVISPSSRGRSRYEICILSQNSVLLPPPQDSFPIRVLIRDRQFAHRELRNDIYLGLKNPVHFCHRGGGLWTTKDLVYGWALSLAFVAKPVFLYLPSSPDK
jgi:hypothetical protein